jgi:hypothetical protein
MRDATVHILRAASGPTSGVACIINHGIFGSRGGYIANCIENTRRKGHAYQLVASKAGSGLAGLFGLLGEGVEDAQFTENIGVGGRIVSVLGGQFGVLYPVRVTEYHTNKPLGWCNACNTISKSICIMRCEWHCVVPRAHFASCK